MMLSAASVEMTFVVWVSEFNWRPQVATARRYRFTFPLIAKCAMNGAPGRPLVDEKEQAKATTNAGILRFAQNDKVNHLR
jgi:hypothetical protein